MRLNPTYLFLGLVSAALSISSTCAVPLNVSPRDGLATRAPVQDTVSVNAGPAGSLSTRTLTQDTESVDAVISLATRENHGVDVVFSSAALPRSKGYVRNTEQVKREVNKVVNGYWKKMGLSGEVITTLKNCPRNDLVDDFIVSGSGVKGKSLFFRRLSPTLWAHEATIWEV
ncbi:uncharacterized protein C8R40DRAFT_1124304 [Lentinula edodes]|uniref:uncharacterized protein n=1 Tax=Lentinula edodes TaxID=5353 RepID=UPI001E8E1BFE|nr:uncharacterized protein C8R40DRAFT_1124304 [Lentinula edodes]KAH7870891.1 hypothetical protein C8R40DRAFT_1124304 [Lentinula edodes]